VDELLLLLIHAGDDALNISFVCNLDVPCLVVAVPGVVAAS